MELNINMDGSIYNIDGTDDVRLSEDLNKCTDIMTVYVTAFIFGSTYGSIDIRQSETAFYERIL